MPTAHKIEWLLDTEVSNSEIGLLTKKIEIPYPPQLAKGHSEQLINPSSINTINLFIHFYQTND
jgi:hypothetical protein